jgi:hypothetical protein
MAFAPLSLGTMSSHDAGVGSGISDCCCRTKAAARAPASVRIARAIPIVRHGAGCSGPAPSPRRRCTRRLGHLAMTKAVAKGRAAGLPA